MWCFHKQNYINQLLFCNYYNLIYNNQSLIKLTLTGISTLFQIQNFNNLFNLPRINSDFIDFGSHAIINERTK
jgi:hypothetical protein